MKDFTIVIYLKKKMQYLSIFYFYMTFHSYIQLAAQECLNISLSFHERSDEPVY